MRQRLALIVAALALVAAPSTAFAVDPTQPAYGGPLSGAQEVPAVATTATGQGTAVISADGSTITYIVTYSGLSGTVNAAHIHTGAAGVAGGVILPLTAGPSPMVGTLTAANFVASGAVTTFAQAVAAIRAGTTYFNLHTTANPGGEIRGQILAAGDAYFAALNGTQEAPAGLDHRQRQGPRRDQRRRQHGHLPGDATAACPAPSTPPTSTRASRASRAASSCPWSPDRVR